VTELKVPEVSLVVLIGVCGAASATSVPSHCASTPSVSKPWNARPVANRSGVSTNRSSPYSRWSPNPSTHGCEISVALGRERLRCWRPMGALDAIAARVAEGQTVDFRPSGSSMVPLIRSRQLVTVAPVDPTKVEVGDIVLARVAGTTYLHLVSAVDAGSGRVQISNNRGRVNGWTNHARLYGICTAVDGVARPRTDGKTRRP